MRTPRAFSVWWMGLIVGCLAVMTAQRAHSQPVARDDVFSTSEGSGLSIENSGGVLANDTGAGLEAVLVSTVSNGVLLFGAGGGFFYLPNIGFTGNDTFTYQAREGSALSSVATATISVIPSGGGNVPPVARADSYSTNEDQTLAVAASGVLANDSDANANALAAGLITGVSSGTLALQADGSFSYTPPSGFSGVVTFTYQADDGAVRSNTATVTITVVAVNDVPVAQADNFTTTEDVALTVAGNGVLANDTDGDGDALTAALVRNVSNGTVQLNANGTFTYTPPTNFSGTTSFTYSAHDASAQSPAATVTLTVTAVNDPPFISNSPPTTATEGVTYRYTLAATDPDGTTPTITAPTLPGWLTFTAPATISGTPADGDVGTHEVSMSVTDSIAAAVTSRFQITVRGVDNPPHIASIPEQTATEGTPFDFDLRAFITDSDTATGSLTFAATGGVPSGIALSPAGRLSGTPQVGSVGTHTIRFTVADAETSVAGQLRLVVLPAGRVDLTVTMSASPNPVTRDVPTTWTITVANRAPQVEAPGASLEATFAGEVPFRFDPVTTPGCTVTPSGDQNTLACSVGRLAGGASTTITLTGRGSFAGDVFAGARVAVAGGGALDETPSNDSTTAALSVAQRVAGLPAQRITPANAREAAAGDLNGDGFDELVVSTAQGLALFTNVADAANPGRRSFATPPEALGGEPLANDVAVVDLDRDGDLDIVTAGNAAPNRVFLNSGGTFSSAPLGGAVDSRAIAVADINGDAFVDLVFANSGTSTVLINTGSGGTFTAAAGVGPHDARGVVLADLVGDALPELVVASGNGGAAVYRNTGGSFTLEATLATGPTSAVSSGDFNGDQRRDVVFARETATLPAVPSALVMLNPTGGGPLHVSDELGAAAAASLLVRDFNLDGRADVFALNGYGARIFTNAGSGTGTFALHPQQLATPGSRGAAAGKFSNDDRIDVAVVGEPNIGVFVNDGAGNFGQPDSNAPAIQLRGEATVNLTIDSAYTDAGATASDTEDGDITSRIVVTNAVNTAALGTYTVTYQVSDLSGNSATPVTRTVNVKPQAGAEGGGGGGFGLETLAALLLLQALAAVRRRKEREARPTAAASRSRRAYATARRGATRVGAGTRRARRD
jgi:VCBS repeat-containing protein